jgi:hypothetical protein
MEPSEYEIPLCKILYFIKRYGTTGGKRQMWMHNRSKNGCGA